MMATTVDALKIRRVMGRKLWGPPRENGPDGWVFLGDNGNEGQIIVTAADWEEPNHCGNPECLANCNVCVEFYDNNTEERFDFIHASIARPTMPTYEDLALLHKAVFPGFAYQVFAPPESHVNIHETALHLWGRADGKPWGIPDFGGIWGTI